MRLFHILWRDQRGSSFMELAFVMPILVLMVMGGVELSAYMLAHQKMNRVAMSTADLVAQAKEMTQNELDNIFAAIDYSSGRSNFGDEGVVIVTSVHKTGDNPPVIAWQQRNQSAFAEGTPTASHVGTTVGGPAILPPNLTLSPGDGLLIAEVVFHYRPLIYSSVVGETNLYHVAYDRPRFGALLTIAP